MTKSGNMRTPLFITVGLILSIGCGYIAWIGSDYEWGKDPHGGDVTGFSEHWIVLDSAVPIEVVREYEQAADWITQQGFEQIAPPEPCLPRIGAAEQPIRVQWYRGRVEGSEPFVIQLILALEYDESQHSGRLSLRAPCIWDDHTEGSSDRVSGFTRTMSQWWAGREAEINAFMHERREAMWSEWNSRQTGQAVSN